MVNVNLNQIKISPEFNKLFKKFFNNQSDNFMASIIKALEILSEPSPPKKNNREPQTLMSIVGLRSKNFSQILKTNIEKYSNKKYFNKFLPIRHEQLNKPLDSLVYNKRYLRKTHYRGNSYEYKFREELKIFDFISEYIKIIRDKYSKIKSIIENNSIDRNQRQDSVNDYVNYLFKFKFFFEEEIEELLKIQVEYFNLETFKSDKPEVFCKLASIYEVQNNLDYTEKCYERALHIEPTNFDTWFFYAVSLSRLGNLNIKDLKETIFKASSENNNNPEIWNMLGLFYWKTKDFNKALDVLKKSLKIDKDNIIAHKLLFIIYYDLNLFDMANKQINLIKKLYKTDPQMWFLQGLLYYGKGDYPKAIENFDESLKEYSKADFFESIIVSYYKALTYKELKDGIKMFRSLDKVRELCKISLTKFPLKLINKLLILYNPFTSVFETPIEFYTTSIFEFCDDIEFLDFLVDQVVKHYKEENEHIEKLFNYRKKNLLQYMKTPDGFYLFNYIILKKNFFS